MGIQFHNPTLEPRDFFLIFLNIGNQTFYSFRIQRCVIFGMADALFSDFPVEALNFGFLFLDLIFNDVAFTFLGGLAFRLDGVNPVTDGFACFLSQIGHFFKLAADLVYSDFAQII